MKIHITIEVDGSGEPRVEVSRQSARRMARPSASNEEAPFTPEAAGKPAAPVVKIADVPPAPLPPEADPEPPKCKPGSGPQFDPGFLAILRDLPQPFTRRAVGVASGMDLFDVTLRLNRMKHKGWLSSPSKGLWLRTATFGEKKRVEE